MSKKGATLLAGSIVAVLALFVIVNFLMPWDSPLRIIFMNKKFKQEQLLHNAMINYQMDEMKAAKPQFKELLKLDPRNADLHYRMGVVLSRLGETDNAIKEFDQAFALSDKKMGEAPASVAAIHIQQGEDMLKNDKYRDARMYFDKAEERMQQANLAADTQPKEKKENLKKQFNLLRGQVYIGQGLCALLHMDQTDVAIEHFKTAENVLDAVQDMKPFREYRRLALAYADLARVYGISYLDNRAANKYWKKSFAIMEKAMASATVDMAKEKRFGDPYKVFRDKYAMELEDLKSEAKGDKKPPAPAVEPDKIDDANDLFK